MPGEPPQGPGTTIYTAWLKRTQEYILSQNSCLSVQPQPLFRFGRGLLDHPLNWQTNHELGDCTCLVDWLVQSGLIRARTLVEQLHSAGQRIHCMRMAFGIDSITLIHVFAPLEDSFSPNKPAGSP
jgi:hypothetical protein